MKWSRGILLMAALAAYGVVVQLAGGLLKEVFGVEHRAVAEPLIPTGQRDVDTDLQITMSTSYLTIPNSSVTINNGTSQRRVVVTFSAEAAAVGAAMGIAFKVDNGSCLVGTGPQTLIGSSGFEARTVVHVITIGPGTHTIRPCFKSSSGGLVEVEFRTLTAEGRTQ